MRGWVVALVVTVAAVVSIGVGVIVAVTSSGDTALVDLEVGDCFDLPEGEGDDGDLGAVATVDCDTPHLAEVVLVGGLNPDGAPYPTDEELFVEIERRCRAVDIADAGAFGLLPVAPTPEVWESFEGRFLCVAIPFGGEPVTGTVVADGSSD